MKFNNTTFSCKVCQKNLLHQIKGGQMESSMKIAVHNSKDSTTDHLLEHTGEIKTVSDEDGLLSPDELLAVKSVQGHIHMTPF